jgi:tetratricopeptide (TPR) repeat protein
MKIKLARYAQLISLAAITSVASSCGLFGPSKESQAKDAYNEGVSQVNSGDYQHALVSFSEVIGLNPNAADAYGWRAYVNNVLGKSDAALADCEEAIKLNPNLAQPYSIRGRIRYLAQDYPNAISDCTSALRIDPTSGTTYSTRAFSYVRLHEYKKAADDFTTYLQVAGKKLSADESAAIYGYRAICNLALKNYAEVVKDSTASIGFDSGVPQAYLARAQAYKQLGNTDLARKDMAKYDQLRKIAQARQAAPQMVPMFALPGR